MSDRLPGGCNASLMLMIATLLHLLQQHTTPLTCKTWASARCMNPTRTQQQPGSAVSTCARNVSHTQQPKMAATATGAAPAADPILSSMCWGVGLQQQPQSAVPTFAAGSTTPHTLRWARALIWYLKSLHEAIQGSSACKPPHKSANHSPGAHQSLCPCA
jgi:hypothetical protein